MTSIYLIFDILNIKISKIKRLGITFSIFFLYNPFFILSASTQFSFLSILALCTIYELLFSYMKVYVYQNIYEDKLKQIIIKILKIICVSLSINLMLIPLQIYYFGFITPIFLITSFIFSILQNTVTTFGVVSLFFLKFGALGKFILRFKLLYIFFYRKDNKLFL